MNRIYRLTFLASLLLLGATAAQASPLGSGGGMLRPPAAVTQIHGCHGSYGHDMRGWHRHGKRCETQRGLARVKRDKRRAI